MNELGSTLAELAAEECTNCGQEVGSGWVSILRGESAVWYCTRNVACRLALRTAVGCDPTHDELLARITVLEAQLEEARDELEFLWPRATEH